jgi:SAM-dependent methyltransferase
MIDGSTYYKKQSEARGIHSINDVVRVSAQEKVCFDQLILPFLPKEKSAVIYEAATGPGILQQWLNSRGFTNLEGSDFAENEAKMAGQVNPRVVYGDSISDLEERFQPESFSAIIALDFFEHIPRERFRNFLAIAATRLNKDGVLILRGPNADSPFVGLNLYNDITHVWAYTTVCLRVLALLAGFNKVEFADDTVGSIHRGGWWKRPLMVAAQKVLTFLFHAATRQRVALWGSSVYVYAYR